jgi:hypothetical protein
MQIETSVKFVNGKGSIHALDLFFLVVKHSNFIGKFSHDYCDDCLGLDGINRWSFFGLGSEFQLQNQGIRISGHWDGRGEVASGKCDFVIIGRSGGDIFLGIVQREKGHVNVHGWSCSKGGHTVQSVRCWFLW